MTRSLSRAQKAWVTRRSAVYRARRTARDSQVSLELWAKEHGWRVVFLDAPSGGPRTGIVDAVLLRIHPRSKDQIDIRLVQLKSGVAGLTGTEFDRLCSAVERVSAEGLAALCNGTAVFTAPVSRAVVTGVELLRPNPSLQRTRRKRPAAEL
ncbi:MAG: hypothetical protein NTY23_07770 [Chloroflexi bacterium]|nr:hypothetical protein [Chloroflexota bacterium]